jgi:hypothetical protein
MASTFPMVPATGSWMLGVIAAFCIAALGFAVIRLGGSLVGSQRSSFEVSAAGFRLSGDFYGRTIPPAHLVGPEIRVVNLAHETGLRPVRRLNGTGLPGYRAGWFRLANGQKALLYVTDEAKVVYVPTTEGYGVLVSPLDPDGLAEQLRQIAP